VVPARYRAMDRDSGRRGRYGAARSDRGAFPAPRFVTQRVDHFDGSNTDTWQQAYYVNDTFWAPGSSAPVFLCVGGEGPPLDGSAVVASVHCNDAVELIVEMKALMFALEHRYYGCWNASACPVADLSKPGALRFHSSRQALGDIAGFVQHALGAYGLLPDRNKWVTWGGSYPGMLAGWARLKFPHLIHAAISSSAPVRAELDMRGYNDVVAHAYAVSHELVGGSRNCSRAIAEGHRRIGVMFQSEAGRKSLSAAFGLTPEWYAVRDNQAAFAGQGVADFPAQANEPSCQEPMCNIAKICGAMVDATLGDEVQRLAHVRKKQQLGGDLAAEVAVGRAQPAPGFDGANIWGWQTCTEFGFYQTCETGSDCFYTQGLADVGSEMGFCGGAFNLSRTAVEANIEYTNAFYGADKPAGQRVLYVNGEVDPWHSNSINSPVSSELPAIYVDGASHHAWTHPSSPADQASVRAARAEIRRRLLLFLAEPRATADVLV